MVRVSEEMRYKKTEGRERRTRQSRLLGPPRRYTKDAEMGEGAEGYATQPDRRNEHAVEASASVSSPSHDRNGSGMRVDRESLDPPLLDLERDERL